MLCWNWSLQSASPAIGRKFSSLDYAGIGVRPPRNRAEQQKQNRYCCIFAGILFMAVALVMTASYNIPIKNAKSNFTTKTFSEHTTITATTELMDSKVNNTGGDKNNSNAVTSTDILAITSSTDNNGETSSETVLVTKKTIKMHRERNTSTFGIPSSTVVMPTSVEVTKSSVKIFNDNTTESYLKYKTKKRMLFNSLTNKFVEINIAEQSTEGERNIKPPNRDPGTHKILKEVWGKLLEYPSNANDKK